jgi:hypothetical protein
VIKNDSKKKVEKEVEIKKKARGKIGSQSVFPTT